MNLTSLSPLFPQGRVAEAESMFTKMKETGCQPDVIAYTTMIHAYGESGSLKLRT